MLKSEYKPSAIEYLSKATGTKKRTRIIKTENMFNRTLESFKQFGIPVVAIPQRADLEIIHGPFTKPKILVQPFCAQYTYTVNYTPKT